MELKDYQADVLSDLSEYLGTLLECKGHLPNAFTKYWKDRGVLNQAYKNNIKEVPHVCVKVPTAGGKTFIAVNALDRIFSAFAEYNPTRPKFVVWLVPSLTILEQTVKNLCNIDHPYRQRLNDLFNGRVQIYEKADVLQGAGFNADTVKEQLSVVVMSFDSLKATNKENRKAFQENGYLASFLNDDSEIVEPLEGTDPSALINIMRTLRPVVVVDESHNAESTLSVDMLRDLNPSFIFDLTATPRDNSNIISYVDALRLKKQNMVKLPVIVANQRSQEDVIMAALNMRRQLEEFAKKSEEKGGGYIRPIVLFQAEPKNKDDTTTFEKVREILLELNIPKEHIAIKTANINELKNVDLMSRDCQVRYIITVNALKEGWDCPFAYVLATLANKSSVVDVTQILGRVLRMPYTRKHSIELLNLSYVFTSSSHFQNTLTQVVEGLNKAGFSKRDYREFDLSGIEQEWGSTPSPTQEQLNLTTLTGEDKPAETGDRQDIEIEKSKLNPDWEQSAVEQAATAYGSENQQPAATVNDSTGIEAIKAQAVAQAQQFEEQASATNGEACPEELKAHMNEHKMKPIFEELAKAIQLPQFFIKLPSDGGFFDSGDEWHKLAKENLLSNFVLANLDATINFTAIESDVYKVDAEEIGNGESAPSFTVVKKAEKEKLNSIIKSQPTSGQITSIIGRLFSLIGKNTFYPIEDNDVKHYLKRIVEALNADQRADCLERDYAYAKLIKDKVQSLANEYAAKEFGNWLTTQKIKLRPSFLLPATITPSDNAPAISHSLYVTEGTVNNLESKVIRGVAELENIVWWHKNLERGKGFVINGFLNHYPDFIVLTESKNIIVVETKGDDRDNSDSKSKLKLGKIWESQANQIAHETGYRYHYMMVFESNPIDGAYTTGDVLKLIEAL
ncbi:DEAD/DEAH box helicase family protein [Methylobacillus gramineus]|uniref:DEAD/DEAH box helicase n=1 Tax=Methylobacillus gramineus TaxID=755169 RepID=UPI001CFFB0B7|nr:DEAD/DEAH box helicase family protein [Methylobacillus gramineus]MCB5183977.1 DEAD/DEAH box helicase family protein [Methylobacillus gramineus]